MLNVTITVELSEPDMKDLELTANVAAIKSNTVLSSLCAIFIPVYVYLRHSG